jgi:hypothetical protein
VREYGLGPRPPSQGAIIAPFGLAAAVFVLASTSVGYQDVAELLTPQSDVAPKHDRLDLSSIASVRSVAVASPAAFTASITSRAGIKYASLDGSPEVVSLIPQPDQAFDAPLAFPTVNRSDKGDLLVSRPRPSSDQQAEPRPEPLPAEFEAAMRGPASTDEGAATAEQSLPADEGFQPGPAGVAAERGHADLSILEAAADPDPTRHLPQIYFDAEPADASNASIEPWAPGEEPVSATPHARVDGDLKTFALARPGTDVDQKPGEAGVSVAGKGEVTGEGRRPKSPAERLGLDFRARAKAERCLANAIYFEARGEQVRGQIAVAQVVMNRVFSGYYPDDVCGVVYQNAHHHLACQFTFACDGRSKAVREPEAYVRARRIAKETLDGRLWLSDIGKATHYHAYWVHPRWVREMHKIDRIGVHTFYRPRGWGSGADAPSWGSAQETAAIAATL